MRRSPVAVGLVLGIVVGAASVAAIAATESESASPPPKVVVMAPATRGEVPFAVQAALPDLHGEAKGYRLGSEPAAGAIQRLAGAFDVHGPVTSDAGGWVVREDNRLVRVQRTAGLPWFFSTFEGPCKAVPDTAAPSNEVLPPVAPPGPTDCPDSAAVPPAAAPAAILGHDDALAFGMETLGRAGLGVSRPVIVEQVGAWHVEAAPLLGDKPTSGFAWSITIGPGRTVAAASGYLAKAIATDAYSLVGTAKGLERAKSVSGGTITGVRLGVMLGHVGRAPYLVPAYLFELEGRPPPVVPVPAIADRYLA